MDIDEAKKLICYCGAFCGECKLNGRIHSRIAQELLQIANDYSQWLPKVVKLDFDFNEFMKGLEYFSKADKGPYCQVPCKEGGGPTCKRRPCAKAKGLEICYDCDDFPCEYMNWGSRTITEKTEDCERYKKLGLEGWLKFHIERAEKGYLQTTRKYYTEPQTD
jgi:hypothetical protein